MHIRDPPLEGTLEWQKPAPHNFIYCACSSVKREPRCYIRAPPSVAIFQQVMGPVREDAPCSGFSGLWIWIQISSIIHNRYYNRGACSHFLLNLLPNAKVN